MAIVTLGVKYLLASGIICPNFLAAALIKYVVACAGRKKPLRTFDCVAILSSCKLLKYDLDNVFGIGRAGTERCSDISPKAIFVSTVQKVELRATAAFKSGNTLRRFRFGTHEVDAFPLTREDQILQRVSSFRLSLCATRPSIVLQIVWRAPGERHAFAIMPRLESCRESRTGLVDRSVLRSDPVRGPPICWR